MLACCIKGQPLQRPTPPRCRAPRVHSHSFIRCMRNSTSDGGLESKDFKVVQQLQHLKSQHSQLEVEEVDKLVSEIEAASSEAGTNKVVPEWHVGEFWATPISGRLRILTADDAPLTMGGLTFATIKPTDLQLALRPLGRPTLVKGERGGVPNAYSLTSAFSVVGKDLHGECNLVGTFHADADSPQRLHVAFTEVIITPDIQGRDEVHKKEALQQWLDLFEVPNPVGATDPHTGRIAVKLESPAKVWLDFRVMVPDWQLFRSQHGSVALLQRA